MERRLIMTIEQKARPVITLVSDFGDTWAKSQVELVIHTINPEVKFITLENEVTPFSIIEGAFVIAKSFRFSPRNSIHIGVVDPGVGSERRGLMIRSQDYWFVGPDNGLLYPAASESGIEQVYAIDEQRVSRTGLNTFHGRDVFAPAAALLSLGHSPLDFSDPIDPHSVKELFLRENQVVRIDHQYGNIKLASHPKELGIGDQVHVDFRTGRIVIPYCRTFSDMPKGELLAYRGSHETLELAKNLGSAVDLLQVEVGQVLGISPVRAGFEKAFRGGS